MRDSKQFAQDLIDQYLIGAATEAQRNQLERLYAQASIEKPYKEDLDADVLNQLKKDSFAAILTEIRKGETKTISLWPRIAVVAAAVAAITLGVWFYTNRHPEGSVATKDLLNYANDIAPGTQSATLTLANGKKIKLSAASNGELAKQAGVTITKSADGQLIYVIPSERSDEGSLETVTNTLTTANGETYQVRLPDGSMVWLNAASSLTYSANLIERGERRVRLDGEAYFEVAKDKAHPFVVQTRIQEVEVLGTHFNINSYSDEPSVATTLLEGSVKIKAGPASQIIKPGEQGLSTALEIKVTPADLEEVTAWKEGDLIFNDDGIETVMQQIARWYDVDVIYQGEKPKGTFYVHISRDTKISEVLKALQLTKLVHFKIEGRRVLVRR